MPLDSDLNKNKIPKWNDLVKMERAKVVFVDWEKDFYLIELANSQDENIRKTAHQTRERFYKFLERTKTLSLNSEKTKRGNFSVLKQRKRIYTIDRVLESYYRVGPSINDKMYYFSNKEIAEEWARCFQKRTREWKVYIED